jgi:NADH:ubiquinone oxidoreductase subunit 4 (subunit M)
MLLWNEAKSDYMRDYLKILLTTVGIQLASVAVCFVLYYVKKETQLIPVMIVIGYVGSLFMDIYSAVKMDAAWYKKIACILFMPTNYSPILLLWFSLYAFAKFFQMIPINMG